MYSVTVILLLVGLVLIGVGFLGQAGTGGMEDVDASVASAFGLIFTYVILIMSFSSFSELVPFFENLCGGIPYLDLIADYGTFENILHQDLTGAVVAFLDAVILSAMIDLLSLLPLAQGNARGRFMVRCFTGVLIAIIPLIILNYVIKGAAIYHWIVSGIGLVISVASIGTIPLMVFAIRNRTFISGAGLISLVLMFSQSKFAGVMRGAFFKAIVYVGGIWILEKEFGSLAEGMSQISILLTAFGPVFVMLLGIFLIIRSVMPK